jgi:hypothetical protein
MLLVAIALVTLAGPDGQRIDVNPAEVVSVREPRESQAEHFDPSIKCVLQTADGKLIAVVTDCATVRQRLGAAR